MEIFIPAILGFVAGVIGSLVAPWVQWAVEKRRSTLIYRRELIKLWREEIQEFDHSSDEFGNTATYSAIRPHIKPEIRDKIEAPRTYFVPGARGEMVRKQMLLDEVARIEKEWKLV